MVGDNQQVGVVVFREVQEMDAQGGPVQRGVRQRKHKLAIDLIGVDFPDPDLAGNDRDCPNTIVHEGQIVKPVGIEIAEPFSRAPQGDVDRAGAHRFQVIPAPQLDRPVEHVVTRLLAADHDVAKAISVDIAKIPRAHDTVRRGAAFDPIGVVDIAGRLGGNVQAVFVVRRDRGYRKLVCVGLDGPER